MYRREIRAALDAMGGALEDVTEALIDRARGIRVLQIIEPHTRAFRELGKDQAAALVKDAALVDAALASGQARVYAYPPELDAIKVLMDRVMGKVPTVVEIDLRARLEQTQADHALIASVIREHVPDDYLGPVVAELERIARRRQADEAVV